MSVVVHKTERRITIRTYRAGLRGLPGDTGAPGPRFAVLDALTWTAINTLADPVAGDAYLLTALDAAAPTRPDGAAAAIGDALQWSGNAWLNLGGPIEGPVGPAGAASTVPGPQGPAGADGHIGVDGQNGAAGHSPVLTWVSDQIAIDGSVSGAPHLTGPAGAAGISGSPGSPGAAGIRGSKFLGTYATTGVLPAIDGVTVMAGDYAYVSGTGELWVAA
jgi:hypothetical protein